MSLLHKQDMDVSEIQSEQATDNMSAGWKNDAMNSEDSSSVRQACDAHIDDNVSVCSDSSTAKTSKSKKRVTFEADDNLVLVYEIPRWEDSDLSEKLDPCNADTLASELSVTRLHNPQPAAFNAKGKYEIDKTTDKHINIVAQITGLTQLAHKGKQCAARNGFLHLRHDRAIRNNQIIDGQTSESNGDIDGQSPSLDKDLLVVGTPKFRESKSKSAKKAQSNHKSNRKKHVKLPKVKTSSHMRNTVKYKHRDADTKANLVGMPIATSLRDKNISFHVSSTKLRINNVAYKPDSSYQGGHQGSAVPRVDQFIFPPEVGFGQTKEPGSGNLVRLDSASSLKSKRIYAWHLANGSVLKPQFETPCISPMWETGLQSTDFRSLYYNM